MTVEKTLYLHIGLPKCGSSSLQIFFAMNIDFLNANNICYPEIFPLRKMALQGYGQGNAYSLVYSLLPEEQKHITTCTYPQVNLSDMFALVGENANILLSTEWFTVLGQSRLVCIRNEAENRGFSVQVFYCYRDIFSWIASELKQGLKMGKIASISDAKIANPFLAISLFEDIFGVNNVKGIFLNKGLDIYKTSLNFLGVNRSNYSTPSFIANQSLCDLALYIQMQASNISKPLSQEIITKLDKTLRGRGLGEVKIIDLLSISERFAEEVKMSIKNSCQSIDKEKAFPNHSSSSISDKIDTRIDSKTFDELVDTAHDFYGNVKTHGQANETLSYILNYSLITLK